MSYITANGSNLATVLNGAGFRTGVLTADVSFTSLVTYTKYIQNSFVVLSSTTTFTKTNLPNIIYISGSTNFSITLPTDVSLIGTIIHVRQISGTAPLSITYPSNGIRLANTPTSPFSNMSYSLFAAQDGSNLLYWYLTYYI